MRSQAAVDGALMSGTVHDLTDRLEADAASLSAASDAQAALELLAAVRWEWDLDAREVVVEVFGDSPWSEALPEGRIADAAFLALVAEEDRTAIRSCAGTARDSGAMVLRLVPAAGGHDIRLHWRSHTDRSGRVVRIDGVALPALGEAAGSS